MPKFLISYRAEHKGRVIYGYEIADCPIEWVQSVQKFTETYILLNAQPMTDDQAEKYDGVFKGM
jgi:hypothetical protein